MDLPTQMHCKHYNVSYRVPTPSFYKRDIRDITKASKGIKNLFYQISSKGNNCNNQLVKKNQKNVTSKESSSCTLQNKSEEHQYSLNFKAGNLSKSAKIRNRSCCKKNM